MLAIFLHYDVHIWLPMGPYILAAEISMCSLSNIGLNFYVYFNFTARRLGFHSKPSTSIGFLFSKYQSQPCLLHDLHLFQIKTSRAQTCLCTRRVKCRSICRLYADNSTIQQCSNNIFVIENNLNYDLHLLIKEWLLKFTINKSCIFQFLTKCFVV